ncbi:hypothetical protein CHLNCDRAFT_141190 [Chlorella variabilis]|uniref:OTU domain-containing protein n=1 Tax=Chlorella variabilis TaxID=554065 RepID=E1ZSA2_CHLVA|nr:hypothetical protein CHLNCDRAFT_141190 [Chlorella variabilis]EFN51212.1 hypothetical protein CHLNCDRAFT_141190 [Chlorella variabilis]|eukprot:XP_005843314.1 hypothetical protein CHLNCDRAFT_141190 [Chlorella variabilis]
MACLAFGRATLLSHPSFGNRQADDAEWRHQLTVQNDLARITQENAVFDALAQQVTAFVCNLDEATVNCGAAEPHTIHISSSSGSGSSAGGSLSRSSSRGTSSGGAGDGSGTRSPAGCNSSDSSPAALASSHFRRLRAFPHRRSGFGWRDARAAFESAMRQENRVERMVARSDPAAAEKRLQQRLLVAKLEAVAFKGCAAANSLFDALSLALWGTAVFGPTLRALGVGYAANHPEEYSCFLGDDWESYLSGMAQAGTPGDELMLRAVADHFGFSVNIATSDAFMWFQRYSPAKTMTHREVNLAFLGPNTWMPVRRQSTITTLKLSLSGGSEWRQARETRRKMHQLDMHPAAPTL